MENNKPATPAPVAPVAKIKKLEEPKEFTVTEPFTYGDKRFNKRDKIMLDDVKTIKNLTPKYIR